MPWTDASFQPTTDNAQLGTITLTFTDAAEFPDANPFVFNHDHHSIAAGSLGALRTAANNALAAERTRRQNAATRKAQLLTALNN